MRLFRRYRSIAAARLAAAIRGSSAILESLEGRLLFADTTGPTAALNTNQPPPPQPGDAGFVFNVIYTDNIAVRGASLGDDDIRVTGPNGFNQLAHYIPNAPPTAPTVTAQYSVNAPSGGFVATDSGNYNFSIEVFNGGVPNSSVTDTSLNPIAPGPFGTLTLNIGTPTAKLAPGQPAATEGASGFIFIVDYSDDVGIDLTQLDDSDVVLKNNNGFSESATFVSIVNPPQIPGAPQPLTRVMYHVNAPNGTLTTSDLGTYFAVMETFVPPTAAGAADTEGHAVPGGTFGSFQLQFSNPMPGTDTTPPQGVVTGDQTPPIFQAPGYVFTVDYTDNVSVDAATLGSDDVMVTGPNGFSQVAIYVGGNVPSGTLVKAAYRVSAPGGVIDAADSGEYTVSTVPTTSDPLSGVRDLDGNAIAAASATLGTFTFDFTTPPPAPPPPPPTGTSGGDLAISSVGFPPGQYPPGGQINLRVLVTNVGTANTGTFSIVIGLSLTGSFEGAGSFEELPLMTQQVQQPLRPGEVVPVRVPAAIIPPGLPPGAYFLGVKIVSSEDVDPTLKGNNYFISPTPAVMIAPPPGAPLPPPIGGFDTSYGTGGIVRQRTGLTSTTAVAVQADGKTVAVGPSSTPQGNDFAITRFNTDGSLDLTFGAGTGTGYIDFGNNDDTPIAVRVLPDGRLLVAGTSSAGLSSEGGSDFAIARFNSDGSPDMSFGNLGRARTNFGAAVIPGPGVPPPTPSFDVAHDLVLLSDGRFLVSGRSDAAGLGTDFALARYNADGSPDNSFNGTGKVTTDFAGGDDSAHAIAIDSRSGQIVAAGSATLTGGAIAFATARYRADGTLDSSFATGGMVTTSIYGQDDEAFAVAIGSKGQITVAGAATTGTTGSDIALVRYTSKGALDKTFGSNGIVVTPFGQPAAGNQMQLLDDGSVLVAGGTVSSLASVDATHLDVALALYSSKGELNPSFDSDGKSILNLGTSVASSAPVVGSSMIMVAAASQAQQALSILANQRAIAEALNGELIAVATNGEDTVSAQIIASGADLSSSVISKLLASVVGGVKSSAVVTLTDAGNLPATGTVTLTLYASLDGNVDDADTMLTTIAGKKIKLKAGASKKFSGKFTVPIDLADGNYYILAKIDAGTVEEISATNNTSATPDAIAVAAPFVDITGPSPATPTNPAAGAKVSIPLTLTNEGNSLAKGTVTVTVIVAADTTPASDDTTILTKALKVSLKAGVSKTFKLAALLPSTLAAGTYYLLISTTVSGFTDADDTNNLIEGDAQLVVA
jgi:uncharacterized delta-60 repeat protein